MLSLFLACKTGGDRYGEESAISDGDSWEAKCKKYAAYKTNAKPCSNSTIQVVNGVNNSIYQISSFPALNTLLLFVAKLNWI